MAQKFYVVWQGRQTGIFTDWDSCRKQVEKFAGAKYKSFKTKAEAERAFKNSSSMSTGKTETSSSTISRSSVKKVKTYTAEEIDALEIDVKIFTDGGCEPNPGEAGSGLAVYLANEISGLWYGLYDPQGTNNTAELNALHQAMVMAKDVIEDEQTVAIFCDSKYSIQCITEWAVGWEKKGWVRKGGEIKNLELIKEMFALYQLIKNGVKILHVNGHVGVEGNELADRMSMLAIETKEPKLKRYRKKIDIDTVLAMSRG